MNAIAMVGIVIVMGTLAQILMKMGMTEIGAISLKDMISTKIFRIFFNKFVFLGLGLYALTSVFYLTAISTEDVSFIYPLIGLGYMLTAVLAWAVFGENLTVMRIVGILMISGGAYFVVMKW